MINMAKKYNFMDGLRKHWETEAGKRCNCPNCKTHAEEKKEFLKENGD